MIKLAIIVLNWNGWQDTNACIESLLKLENENLHIYVCDNASSDASVTQIRRWLGENFERCSQLRISSGKAGFELCDAFDNLPSEAARDLPRGDSLNTLTLLQTGKNGGYAFGNNVGVRQALQEGCDYFWVINNDTEVEQDTLTWLLKRMAADPKIGICGSTLVYAGQRDTIQTWGGAKFFPLKGKSHALGGFARRNDPIDASAVEEDMSFVNGASMLVSRAFLTEVGLMREDYFLYWEEIEWCVRGKGRYSLGYAPQSIVYHKVGASIGTKDEGESSPLSDYYMFRNQIWFCWEYSKISLPFVTFNLGRAAFRYMMAGKSRRALTLVRAFFSMPYVPVKR